MKLPKLREKSRREYVKKRQVDQLDMLQGDVQDDEYLFGDFSLSKHEKKELEYKKTVLDLAKDYKKAGELEKIDRYAVCIRTISLGSECPVQKRKMVG
jgi:pre-mRNA-splicing factor ATP-dependent RNA helicase DHX16